MPKLRAEDVQSYYERFAAGETDINSLSEQFSRDALCAFLDSHVEELINAVQGLTPKQLAYRMPGMPQGWDANGDERHYDASELVTHVASGIAFHHWGITRALGGPRPQFPRPPDGVATTGKRGATMGAGGWTGRPRSETLPLLRQTANSFIEYVRGLPDEESRQAVSSMGGFKHLTAHSWLFLDAVHAAMHVAQLREMQAQPDYPGA